MAIRKAAATMAAFVLILGTWLGSAAADQPREWQLNLQEAASPLMDRIHSFHNLLLYIIFGVSVFVLVLLLWVIVRYNARANPTPSKTTHNTMIEVVWTVVPILILVVIAVPSFRLLYYSDKATDATVTIKARGHQWYWSYVYETSYEVDGQGKPVMKDGKPVDKLDKARFVFESRIACRGSNEDSDKKSCAGFEQANGRKPVRLLDVDNPVVVPVGTQIRILTQGMDVIHSWTIPSMGVKMDANPGRINETWIHAKKPGLYYGQCSELCGTDHGFMPIAVKAVPRDEYEKWLEDAKKKFDKIEEPKRAEAPAKK
ncbi:MAG TPA: cytochrome c oxidase subunit II [Alphaproteobacteria bacterium]